MRALLIAAAVILSVSTPQAQEMKSAEPVARDAADRALPSAAITPTSTIIEQLKAAGELKEAPKPVETTAPRIDAVDAKPAGANAAEARPGDVQPVRATPGETRPIEAKPIETKSTESPRPAETKAVETRPAETKPTQAAQARPIKKRVVRKRETDEQKARRIAAKYGVYW